MKYKINYLVSLVFFLATIITIIILNPFASSVINVKNIFLLLVSFLFIHLFKCLRQYLLLIESGLHIKDFILLYTKGTFCSIILPFKSGELYKAFLYGKEVKNYIKGLLTVIVDKVFDAVVLLITMIAFNIINKQAVFTTAIEWVMLIFLILAIIVYSSFSSTYYYLNKYLVLNKTSKKTIVALSILERLNNLYTYIKNMLKGRTLLIVLFTILSWVFEWIFISILNVGDFISYINAVFLGMTNIIFANYIIIGIICFISIIIFYYIRKWCHKNG